MQMKTSAERVADKISHVDDQLDALLLAQANARAAPPMIGGLYLNDIADQIAFHQWRKRLLERVPGATEVQVRGWLQSSLSVLTPAEKACIAGDVRGVRLEAYRAIVAAELYMVALGEHPGQGG